VHDASPELQRRTGVGAAHERSIAARGRVAAGPPGPSTLRLAQPVPVSTAAAKPVPPPAPVAQLWPGGRMAAPLGGAEARALAVRDKRDRGPVSRRRLLPVHSGRLETMA
jgi:hypothetical protein